MFNQIYKTNAMIADSLKAHHAAIKWNSYLSMLYVCAAVAIGGVVL